MVTCARVRIITSVRVSSLHSPKIDRLIKLHCDLLLTDRHLVRLSGCMCVEGDDTPDIALLLTADKLVPTLQPPQVQRSADLLL